MQTLEAIFTRRSIRAFAPEPISDQELQTVIQAAAAAPSGGNSQQSVFIAVRDPQRIAALRALTPGIIGRPAAVVILCLDLRRESGLVGADAGTSLINLGAALENLLLAAHELGLGGCPIGSFHAHGLATLLRLPDEVKPCLLVALGKPKFIPNAPKKLP